MAKGPIVPVWPVGKMEPADIKQDLLRSKEHQGDRALKKNLCFQQHQNSLSNQ